MSVQPSLWSGLSGLVAGKLIIGMNHNPGTSYPIYSSCLFTLLYIYIIYIIYILQRLSFSLDYIESLLLVLLLYVLPLQGWRPGASLSLSDSSNGPCKPSSCNINLLVVHFLLRLIYNSTIFHKVPSKRNLPLNIYITFPHTIFTPTHYM